MRRFKYYCDSKEINNDPTTPFITLRYKRSKFARQIISTEMSKYNKPMAVPYQRLCLSWVAKRGGGVKIAIHQIQYMPGPRFFNKMKNSDLFILLDDVQYEKREFQNRNKIRTALGWQYITIPVIVKGKSRQLIKDVEINKTYDWRAEHLRAIKLNYAKAACFSAYKSEIEAIYKKDYKYLKDAALKTIEFLKNAFGIKTPIVLASDYSVKSVSTQRLIDLCVKAGGAEYISGAGGKDYLDEKLFDESGIKLVYQDFKYPVYPQVYKGFEDNLSALDIVLNCGVDSDKYI